MNKLDALARMQNGRPISRRDIIAYRFLSDISWHDQEWRDAMGSKKAWAIQYVLHAVCHPGATYPDIVTSANRYF